MMMNQEKLTDVLASWNSQRELFFITKLKSQECARVCV